MKQRKVGLKASLTVEASLVMPLILGCIFLLIAADFYLHDMIILNAWGEELLYAEEENNGEIQKEAEKHVIVLKYVTLEKTENLLTKQVVWNQRYQLPLQNLILTVGGNTSVELGGKITAKAYSMSQAMRLMEERN